MPYRSIAAQKVLTNIGAEVVAIAPDETSGVVAAFSSDPVKIALQPMASGVAKVKEISLDYAQGGLLIDKRVALVKSGDDVWAVVDIQHSARIEQVVREARGLYNHPRQAMGLAISWDSQGHDLRVKGSDVEPRSFVLRGDVRACSMDAERCYVAVDGSGGGKYREHRGATPESGTNVKCDLPAASSSFDRLAGGEQLSALYKAGSTEVCLILKEGVGALTTKMVQLPAPVAALCCLETSLFALCSDGLLRLFSGDNLRRISDGGCPDANFEITVKGQGRPTAMASTTKGGNRLWVGTHGGDILRFDAVKGELDLQM